MKRLVDVLLSFIAITILGLVMVVVGVLVFFFLGKPIIFNQIRPGQDCKTFNLYKFRTMRDLYDADGKPLSDAERLTTFGKFLRSTSLDELPSLFNVLKGDMSIVGPRPLLVSYLELYNQRQLLRQSVKPGVTGWAQVNGRNSISWEDKFEFDVWYVENKTLLLDLKIMLLTIKKVVVREGINSTSDETMPKFRGSRSEK